MNILFHNYYEDHNYNNNLFEQRNAVIGDDLLFPFHVLKKIAASENVTVGTSSVISLEKADAIVFIDLPDTSRQHVRRMINSGKPLYLIVFESILVRPISIHNKNINIFKKIFTYDDSIVDDDHFIKINYSFDLPRKIDIDLTKKNKLCTMIAGNKRVRHSQELYSKRIEVIKWFEANHPKDFDLYGMGWDEYHFGNKLPLRILNRFHILKKIAASTFPSYRGIVERKKPILEKYKFAICYENVKDVPGYITEKIFDCFFSGCVPVYLGANNILKYIPKDCFIDKRDFETYEILYKYLVNMSDEKYLSYQKAIVNFLINKSSYIFSAEHFAKTILSNILAKKGTN